MPIVIVGIACSDLPATPNECIRAFSGLGQWQRLGVSTLTIKLSPYPMLLAEVLVPDGDETRVEAIRSLRARLIERCRECLRDCPR